MIKNNTINQLEHLAQKYNAKLVVEESRDGSYVDCIIESGPLDLYVILTNIQGIYLAYGLESSLLPRELYADSIERSHFSEEQRSEEILENLELLLSRKVVFHSKPSLLNKARGYIIMNIDGIKRKIPQKNKRILEI